MDRIEIEVDQTPRPFHFGVGFIGRVLDALDIDFGEFQKKVAKNPFTVVPIMMYESHSLACWLDDKPCELSRGDIIRFVDETGGIGGKAVQKFLAAFRESQNRDAPEAAKEKPAPKKKGRPKAKTTRAKN